MKQSEIQEIVLALVEKYVSRQQIVVDALGDLRPDILLSAAGSETQEKLVELANKYSSIPQMGSWGHNNEWDYHIHGRGCKLVNVVSHEPLEWDAGDIRSFDRFWLLNHLNWLMKQSIKNELVLKLELWLHSQKKTTRDAIFEVLNQLELSGALTISDPLNSNKLVVVLLD